MTKVITELWAIYHVNYVIMKRFIASGNPTWYVGYFLHLLLIFMCQFKCCEKQDYITYNVGYLTLINET